MLQRLPDLQKKAETAKYLVPYVVPEEFMHEEEMQETLQTYKDLQAEYAATHQNIMSLKNDSMNPTELKKEITQLEQEKEQLQTKINLFKSKSNNPEFQGLLEATSKLRKEQEQDAKLQEKHRELVSMIEYYEQQQLQVRQRLVDIKQIQNENLGADRMLDNLKNEVRRNRELANEILGRELNDKQERLQKIEMLLQEPMTT